MLLEQLSQLIIIVGAILGGIGWLIVFLAKKFDGIQKQITQTNDKMETKVSDVLCEERRQNLMMQSKVLELVDSLSKKLEK